ncbi:hypothetical protein [Halobacteriovorax sp.]|uniref:hypothetical protein n=1 Tax=Halobacteriovorax sp. TaxID=2020862 RepID=UPI0035674980
MKTIYLAITLLFISCTTFAKSESLAVKNYIDTDFDAMFEIKVLQYPKVILDCQSFFHQLVVYKDTSIDNEIKQSFHLDFEECYQAHEFLYMSQDKSKPVCLTLDFNQGEIFFSNSPEEECK